MVYQEMSAHKTWAFEKSRHNTEALQTASKLIEAEKVMGAGGVIRRQKGVMGVREGQ